MAQLHRVTTTVFFYFFMLVVSKIDLSSCQVPVLNGKVSCFDCATHNDLSGIMVQVKCNGVKNLATTMTKDTLGSFQVELPSFPTTSTACQAKLLGGATQLYAPKQNMISEIVKARDSSLTISTPLVVYTSCPKSLNHKANCGTGIEGSKTINLPLPREWGLAPTSFYIPFFPIIGIP
ncbi:hypothetical protein ACFE04_029006 [Oxalis oulophora]